MSPAWKPVRASLRLSCCIPIVLVACGIAAAQSVIPPGQDCWHTQCGSTEYDFRNTPIPAGFFDVGSESFSAVVHFGGGAPGGNDTVMQRSGQMTFPATLPATAQVPIEIVSLNLVSCQSITVRYCNGAPSESWSVRVGLSPTPAPAGMMTVTKTHPNGGTFTSQFSVRPQFTFTRAGDGAVRILDTAAQGFPPVSLSTTAPAPWVHTATIPVGPQICGVNFVPGIQEANQSTPGCTSTVQCSRDVGHAGNGHLHVTGHISEPCPCGACCNPATGACTVVSSANPSADCAAGGGMFKGTGTNCASNDGDSIPDCYETGSCCAGSNCQGGSLCEYPTDPTRADTDGDGLNDDVDSFPCNPCLPLNAPNRPATCNQFNPNGDGDCDNDGMCDLCEIQSGASLDCNRNGVPDQCETFPAQSMYFFDVRDNAGPGQSITSPVAPFTVGQGDFPDDGGAGGGRGEGQVLRLNPIVSNGFHLRPAYPNFDGDGNKATGKLWLFADVTDDPSGVGDVISSVGVDIAIDAPVPGRYQIASTVFAWEPPTPLVTWSGTSNGTPAGPGGTLGVNDVRAVKVPVPNIEGSLVPNVPPFSNSPYRLASLTVTAASRGTGCTTAVGHATGSSYTLHMAVDSLLITRVFVNQPGDTQEDVSFGYVGGAPEATVNGNTVGAGSAGYRDAVIQIRMQGDTNGNGGVNSLDIPGFTAAQAAGANLTQIRRYLYDNNNSGTINSLDIPGFTAAQTAPCP